MPGLRAARGDGISHPADRGMRKKSADSLEEIRVGLIKGVDKVRVHIEHRAEFSL